MYFPTIGRVSSAVKTMELTQKWHKRKSEINRSGIINNKTKSADEDGQKVQSLIDRFKTEVADQRKQAAMSSISAKMKSGQDLSPAELEYLKENAPELYEEYVKIQAEREAYEKKLKECETQEEVRSVNAMEMNKFMNEAKAVMSSSIPKEAKLAAMEKIQTRMSYIINDSVKFIASEEFQQLPETRAEAEEERDKDDRKAAEEPGEENPLEDMEKLKEALKRLTESLSGDEKRAGNGSGEHLDKSEDATAGAVDSTATIPDKDKSTGAVSPEERAPDAGLSAPDAGSSMPGGGAGGPNRAPSNNAYNASGGGYNSHSASSHISLEA